MARFRNTLLGVFMGAVSHLLVAHPIVEVRSVHSGILVECKPLIRNEKISSDLASKDYCFVHQDVAVLLAKVQQELETFKYGLKVLEGYRPISSEEKRLLSKVSNACCEGKHDGLYSKGISIYVTLVNKKGEEEEMPPLEELYTKKYKNEFSSLSEKVLYNKTLLEVAMTHQGFTLCENCWWHFFLKDSQYSESYTMTIEELINSESSPDSSHQ